MRRLFSALTIAAAGTFAIPALADGAMTQADADAFYLEIEGGYAWSDGPAISPPGFSYTLSGGGYGTGTVGFDSRGDGALGGFINRAEAWFSYVDHGETNATQAVVTDSFERDYWEIGARFQHDLSQTASDRILLGLEPFYGEFSSGFDRFGAAGSSFIDTDTTVYGAMLSLEYERMVTAETALLLRAAGGFYGSDSDHVRRSVTGGGTSSLSYSDDKTGFRGQLALGLQHKLNPQTTVGLVGRLDYFSEVVSYDSSASISGLFYDDLLSASIGVNLTYIFAGTYQ